ncbi:MAG: hypothetical protein ACOC3T_06090 [Bacteroidota bacterium]
MVFICLGISGLKSQDEVFYYAPNNRPVEDIEDARHMKHVFHRSKRSHVIKSYEKRDKRWMLIEHRRIRTKQKGHQVIRIGSELLFAQKIQRYYESLPGRNYIFRELKGKAEMRKGTASRLIPLHLEGTITEYFPNGNLKSISDYENNQLVSNQNWLIDGSKYIDNYFYSVDEEPNYEPGFSVFRKFILKNLESSEYDISRVNEKIVIGMVIMEDGSVAGVHRVEGKLKLLSEILIKSLEELPGSWTPAILDGEKVRFYLTIPFNFQNESEVLKNLELRNGVLYWD